MRRHLFSDIERVVLAAIELEGNQLAAARAHSGPDAASIRVDRAEPEFKQKLEVLIQKLAVAYPDRPVLCEFEHPMRKAQSVSSISSQEKQEIVGLLLRFMYDVMDAETTQTHLEVA